MEIKKEEFCFPVKDLSSDAVKLSPFDVSLQLRRLPLYNRRFIHTIRSYRISYLPYLFQPQKHASPYFEGSKNHPEVYHNMSIGPYPNVEEFIEKFYNQKVGPDMFTFAIIDKKKPASAVDPEGEVAGMVSYQTASVENQSVELGYIIVLPPFQRTHVTTHTIGLMLQYALDSPELGGLGLRRVVWKADTVNPASVRAASRMGFTQEGILRWERVAPNAEERGKVGNGRNPPPYGNQKDLGRDVVVLSMCWDDWILDGKREFVRGMMDR